MIAHDRDVQVILIKYNYNREALSLTKNAYVIVNENEELTNNYYPQVVSFLHTFRRFLHIHLSNVTEKQRVRENGTVVIS